MRGAHRSLVSIATIAAVAAGLAIATAPATRAATPTGLIHGQILSSDKAVAGATIDLIAWPNAATLAAEPDGATVPLVVVSESTTRSSGGYSLAPDLSSLGSMYQEPNGVVNTEVSYTSGTTSQMFHLPVATAAATADDQASTASPAVLNFDMGAATVAAVELENAACAPTLTYGPCRPVLKL
jgi:hypothetical protein